MVRGVGYFNLLQGTLIPRRGNKAGGKHPKDRDERRHDGEVCAGPADLGQQHYRYQRGDEGGEAGERAVGVFHPINAFILASWACLSAKPFVPPLIARVMPFRSSRSEEPTSELQTLMSISY